MFKRIEVFSNSKQLVGVQYLRAVAVLIVVLDHVTGMSRLPKYFGEDFHIFNGIFESGAVGVDLFFVISGFIIFYVSLNNTSLLPKIETSSFFKHRFIRIMPFLWLVIIGFALLKLLGRGTFPAIEYLRSMTLFPIGAVEPRHVWTLRHEFLFYVLFGIFIIRLKRKWMWLIFWFLTPFIYFGLGLNNTFAGTTAGELFYFLFNKHNINFGIGCFTGYLFKKGYLNYVIETKAGFVICMIAVIPLLVIAHFAGMKTFTQIILCGIGSGIILLFGIALVTEKLGYFDRLGLVLGDASYSIYLVHSAILSSIFGIWSKYQTAPNQLLLLLLTTFMAMIGGVIVHYLIEKPLIKLIKTRIEPKKMVVN